MGIQYRSVGCFSPVAAGFNPRGAMEISPAPLRRLKPAATGSRETGNDMGRSISSGTNLCWVSLYSTQPTNSPLKQRVGWVERSEPNKSAQAAETGLEWKD